MATCSLTKWRRCTGRRASSPQTSSASATTGCPSPSSRRATARLRTSGTTTSRARRRASTPWAWRRRSSAPCATPRTWTQPTRPSCTTTQTSCAAPCTGPWFTARARGTSAGPRASPRSNSWTRWPGVSSAISRWARRRRRNGGPRPCAPAASSAATTQWTRRQSRRCSASTTRTRTAPSTSPSSRTWSSSSAWRPPLPSPSPRAATEAGRSRGLLVQTPPRGRRPPIRAWIPHATRACPPPPLRPRRPSTASAADFATLTTAHGQLAMRHAVRRAVRHLRADMWPRGMAGGARGATG
mmetsp:Transcript_14805/g.43520  ORF Transcript_14805/g.43520 Transcript_14805/m.43520 type:complete len:298 (-) Transcript_14805:220-1113(-)